MNYHIRRIDPYWFTYPAMPVVAIAGAAVAYIGILIGDNNPAGFVSRAMIIVGSSACGIAILAIIKPAISAMTAVLSLLGYSYSIFITPDMQMSGQSFLQKVVSTVLAASIYTVLMDALILAVAFFYNLFGALWGGLQLDIEPSSPGE